MFYAISYIYKIATTPSSGSPSNVPLVVESGRNDSNSRLNIGPNSDMNTSGDNNESTSTNTATIGNFLIFLKTIGQMILNWGVLILMDVLPGLIADYRVVFGIICGVATAGFLYQGYLFKTGAIRIFPKIFELGLICINYAILIWQCAARPSEHFSLLWTSAIIDILLASFTLITCIVGRPFTIDFARESAPPELWTSTVFLGVNLTLSIMWTAVFALDVGFQLLSIYVYPKSAVGNILPGLVLLVLALQITKFYPVYARKRALLARQQRENAAAPPL